MNWTRKRLYSRDYFIDKKLAEGYDLHTAHELWFEHEEERRKAIRQAKQYARDWTKQSNDRRSAEEKYPDHFEGGRSIRGSGA